MQYFGFVNQMVFGFHFESSLFMFFQIPMSFYQIVDDNVMLKDIYVLIWYEF